MTTVSDLACRLRSKNAGPFVLTIDIFCDDAARYRRLCAALSTARVAAIYGQPEARVKRFELDRLRVLKFSMPRPTVQGSLGDRDMHASQWGWLLAAADLEI